MIEDNFCFLIDFRRPMGVKVYQPIGGPFTSTVSNPSLNITLLRLNIGLGTQVDWSGTILVYAHRWIS